MPAADPSADFHDDPLAAMTPATSAMIYARLRETAAVSWSRWFGGWVVTSYAEALEALRDPALRADEPILWLDRLHQKGGPLLPHFRMVLSTISFFTNEPRHGGLRRFLAQVFQRLDLGDLRARLEQRALFVMQEGRAAGSLDLASVYARELALFTIHRILGIPLPACRDLAALAREAAGFFDLVPRSLRQLEVADRRLGELLAYFERLIMQRRREPGDGRIAMMIELADRDLGICDTELAGFCAFFFVAGEETTGTGIAASSVMLLQRPALRARLAAAPDKVPDAVRELLRLSSPFQYVTRVASEDLHLGGRPVQRGQSVHVILAAANRDPAVFANPDDVDIERAGPEAMPFGFGLYRCLGARLATLELEVAISVLLGAPELRLGPAPVGWEQRTRVPALATAMATFRA